MANKHRFIRDLSREKLRDQLQGNGLILNSGPTALRIQSSIPQIVELIELLYPDYPLATEPTLPDAGLRLIARRRLQRWRHPQAQCLVDGRPPFEPMPLELAFPMLEWAMNWAVASRLHRYFLIHAAVVARNDRAVILPAWSGTGKSTLCAALIQRGWRFLSDEFCLLELTRGSIHPLPRPIPLKNESIPAFRSFAPDAVMGPTFLQTRKGDIAHIRPPSTALQALDRPAVPAWVVLPRYQAGSISRLEDVAPDRALLLMASNSFNFNLLGTPAFDALSRLMKSVSCHRLAYSDLNQAVEAMESLPQ